MVSDEMIRVSHWSKFSRFDPRFFISLSLIGIPMSTSDDNLHRLSELLQQLTPCLTEAISNIKKKKENATAKRFLRDEHTPTRVFYMVQNEALLKRLIELIGQHASGAGIIGDDVS